jgi:hypothetical protein
MSVAATAKTIVLHDDIRKDLASALQCKDMVDMGILFSLERQFYLLAGCITAYPRGCSQEICNGPQTTIVAD